MPESNNENGPMWVSQGLRFGGYGHHYPGDMVLNPLDQNMREGSVDQAVIGSIDVTSRYVSTEDESLVDLAVAAGRRAVEDACVDPEEIGLLLLANWTDRQFVPEQAPGVALALGAPQAFAYNTCGACTGFIHATQQAAALLSTGGFGSHAVVICAERFSRRVRPGSKGVLIVGDAAGAAVLTKSGSRSPGLLDSVMYCDGSEREVTTVLPPEGHIRSKRNLIDVAIRSHRRTVDTLLRRNHITMDNIDWFVPHPGTGALHTAIQDQLRIPAERFVTNYAQVGNTGSASIPVMLSEMKADGRLQPGQLVLAPSVGAGWYYGGVLFHV